MITDLAQWFADANGAERVVAVVLGFVTVCLVVRFLEGVK